jgi:hypothetical protein
VVGSGLRLCHVTVKEKKMMKIVDDKIIFESENSIDEDLVIAKLELYTGKTVTEIRELVLKMVTAFNEKYGEEK